jgi:TonB family protein
MTIIWLVVCLTLIGLWRKRRLEYSAILRSGKRPHSGREAETLRRIKSWLGINREIGLVLSSQRVEPGVIGVWKPVVILPENLAGYLTDAELEAAIMHELIHIIRRDNLVGNLHMLLCCLLWFHPFVWLIDQQLLAEREQSCDEEVILASGSSKAYASSILKVCRFCLVWKVPGISSITGSNLKRRIERIMANEVNSRVRLPHKMLAVTILSTLFFFLVAADFLGPDSALAQYARKHARAGTLAATPRTAAPVAYQTQSGPTRITVATKVQSLTESSEPFSVKFETRYDTPLYITAARGCFVTYGDDDRGTSFNVTVFNNFDKRITGFVAAITHPDLRNSYYLRVGGCLIDPKSSFTGELGVLRSIQVNPRLLRVEIEEVRIEDGNVWARRKGGLVAGPSPSLSEAPSGNGPLGEMLVAGSGSRPSDQGPVGQGPVGQGPVGQGPVGQGPVGQGPRGEMALGVAGERDPKGSPDPAGMGSNPDNDRIIRISEGSLEDFAIKRVQPAFPALSKAGKLNGSVVIEVLVGFDGKTENSRVLYASPFGVSEADRAQVVKAVLEAVRQWQFKPMVVEGDRCRMIGEVSFRVQ